MVEACTLGRPHSARRPRGQVAVERGDPVSSGPASAMRVAPVLGPAAGGLDARGSRRRTRRTRRGRRRRRGRSARAARPRRRGSGSTSASAPRLCPLLVDHAGEQHVARGRVGGQPLGGDRPPRRCRPSCRWCRGRACGRRARCGTNASGAAPTTSVWPQNISDRPPPVPRSRPTTFGRPGAASHTSTSSPAARHPRGDHRRHGRLARAAGLEAGVGRVGRDQLREQLRRGRSRRAPHDPRTISSRRAASAAAAASPPRRRPAAARRPRGRARPRAG